MMAVNTQNQIARGLCQSTKEGESIEIEAGDFSISCSKAGTGTIPKKQKKSDGSREIEFVAPDQFTDTSDLTTDKSMVYIQTESPGVRNKATETQSGAQPTPGFANLRDLPGQDGGVLVFEDHDPAEVTVMEGQGYSPIRPPVDIAEGSSEEIGSKLVLNAEV